MQPGRPRSSFIGIALLLATSACVDDPYAGTHEEPTSDDELSLDHADGPAAALWTFYRVAHVDGATLTVRRLSQPDTKCADGKWQVECRVTVLDWSRAGFSQSEAQGAEEAARARRSLLRGKIVLRDVGGVATSVLQVSESWESDVADVAAGIVVRALATTPCTSDACAAVRGTQLNKGGQSTATYATLSGLATPEALAALSSDDGLLVAGSTTAAADAKTFNATQTWHRRVQSDSESDRTDAETCSATALSQFPKDELRVHVIDVGQGDAIFVQTPWQDDPSESLSVLVDAGASGEMPASSPGGAIVVAYLLEAGLSEGDVLDALVVTHAHDDHYGGVERVAASFGIARYTDPGFTGGSAGFIDARDAAREDVEEHHGHMHVPAVGQLVPRVFVASDLFGTRVESTVLWGAEQSRSGDLTNPTGPDVNNTSIVLSLRYGGRQVLLMGDIESAVESALIAAHDAGEIDLASSVLKVAHHGSSRSTSTEFLNRVFARRGNDSYAVISSGRRTFTGSYLPTEATLDRLRTALPPRHLLSTENRDQHKVVGSEHGDDHVLVRIKASGATSACYLPI